MTGEAEHISESIGNGENERIGEMRKLDETEEEEKVVEKEKIKEWWVDV